MHAAATVNISVWSKGHFSYRMSQKLILLQIRGDHTLYNVWSQCADDGGGTRLCYLNEEQLAPSSGCEEKHS